MTKYRIILKAGSLMGWTCLQEKRWLRWRTIFRDLADSEGLENCKQMRKELTNLVEE